MDLKIRLAKEHDFPRLVEILNDAMHYKLTREDHSWGSDTFTDDELRDYAKAAELYVAEQEGEVVGTFAMTWEADAALWGDQPADAGYVHRLAIAGDRHGWKLGEKITEEAERLTREHNRHYLRLDCNADAARLCKYYEDLGFERVETKQMPDNYAAAMYQKTL